MTHTPRKLATTLGRFLGIVMVCAMIAALASCESQPTTTTTTAVHAPPPAQHDHSDPPEQLSNTDPCATLLHDLCGGLLFHLSQHGQLPVRLEDLQPLPGIHNVVSLQCPDSGRAYVYDRVGLPMPDMSGRIHVYDATPAHLGFRWAIKLSDPRRPNQPPIARVIALPDAFFTQ